MAIFRTGMDELYYPLRLTTKREGDSKRSKLEELDLDEKLLAREKLSVDDREQHDLAELGKLERKQNVLSVVMIALIIFISALLSTLMANGARSAVLASSDPLLR